jgi:hypothetical protein
VRIINDALFCLVNLLFALLIFCAMGQAQTQGNLPNVKDAAIDLHIGGSVGVIPWPEDVAVNDTLVMCMNTPIAGGPFLPTDTLANTWTCTTPTQTPAPATNGYVYMCYTKSTGAGADTITTAFPGNNGLMVGGRFIGIGAVDGALQTATLAGPGAGGTSTISTTNTTTINNDIGISCSGISSATTGALLAPSNGEIVAHESTTTDYPVLTQSHTALAGSKVMTDNTWNGAGGFGKTVTSFAKQTFMFQPTTNIALSDTALPNAANGVAYSAQLHCQGGTAAQTYSLVSGVLPVGLTLHGATGIIDGSTAVVGTTALGFRCSDGIITSATDTMNLVVSATFGTPAIRNYYPTFNGTAGGTISVTGAVCGDIIIVLARGADTHSSSGWVTQASGVNNKFTDTFNSTLQRMVIPIAGPPQAPLLAFIFGPITQSGTDVITANNNQNANTALNVSGVFDISNAQAVIDQGSGSSSVLQSGTFANAFTSVVPNTLLLTVATTLQPTVGLSATLSAPFFTNSADSDSFGYSIYGNALVAAAGTTTQTTTVSGAAGFGEWSSLIVPVRPGGVLAACNNFVGAGEKIRRQVW